VEKRLRLVSLYEEKGLALKEGRFELLKDYAAIENIFASIKTIRSIITK
jgi:hypothetical protein